MSEISLLSPGAEIARWAVLPRWAVFGKFPLHPSRMIKSVVTITSAAYKALFVLHFKKVYIFYKLAQLHICKSAELIKIGIYKPPQFENIENIENDRAIVLDSNRT